MKISYRVKDLMKRKSFDEDNLEDLSNCDIARIDISKNAKIGPENKVVVVPTLIIFQDGEEVARFQANIMMKLEATKDEVQEKIDEILMEDF